jgi:EAL domain-containing protein (putative c-di-GMP-specific phosphodiesterase class I)
VVNLTIILARELNLEVVAEGIETAVHLERIRRLGCEFGQGYFFSKPLEAEQADQLLKQQSQRGNAASAGHK